MGTPKVASLKIAFEAESAKLLGDMKKIISETKKMGRRVDRESNRIKYAFNKIRRAAQVVASAYIFTAGVKSLARLVTGVERAEDRISLMTARFRQFGREADAMIKVYEQSQRLSVSLDATAEGMTRLLVATQNLGITQSRLFKVQENIVLLGRAGGTATAEMIGGMRQLSQGLASARLQGEELRSVLENLPLVAIEIAKELGIGIGQLREYAAAGKIIPEVVVRALEEIEIKLEDLPDTFANSVQRIETSWTMLMASMGKKLNSSGIMAFFQGRIDNSRMRFDPMSFMSIGELDFARDMHHALVSELQKVEAERRGPDGKALPPIDLMAERVRGNITYSDIAGDSKYWLQTADQIRTRYQESLEFIKQINAEMNLRNPAKGQMNPDTAWAKFEAGSMMLDEVFAANDAAAAKSLASFLRQYETVEAKVARLQAQLGEFKSAIIAQFGEGEFKRIAFEIDKDLIQMIDTSLIPKLKEIPKVVKKSTEEMSEASKRAAQNIQDAFADFLFDPFDKGVKGMLEGFLTAIRRMIAETAAANLFGEGTGFANFIGGLFGKKAAGGPVGAGGTYLVGERGPELLTMGASSGFITPNHQLATNSGTTVNYNIEAGADVATIMSMVIPALERTQSAAVAEVVTRNREGRL